VGRTKIPQNEKLAKALQALHKINGSEQGVIRGKQLKQADREILQKAGFLKEFLKGWYFLSNPSNESGDNTPFFVNYYEFLSLYLADRFDNNYCLSAEYSLLFHAQTNVIPQQISVIVNTVNQKIDLYENYSLLVYKIKNIISDDLKDVVNGIQCYSAPAALVSLMSKCYETQGSEIQIVMNKIDNPMLIAQLIEHNSQGVSRLIGAYRQIGKHDFADAILKQLIDLGYRISEEKNPFDKQKIVNLNNKKNALYSRINLLWDNFRDDIILLKPDVPELLLSEVDYLSSIETIKVNDAYNSLSIERYKVTPELIQKIADGSWNLLSDENKQQRDAMAAKGYLDAFNLVKKHANQAYLGQHRAVELFIEEHKNWFTNLFMPSVESGILSRSDLIGYRRNLVFLSGSKHVPPHFDHILDGIEALNDCLLKETDAFVNAVMGHLLVGYIHPFMDGNGRTARFTMNVMLAEGRYPWTIIPVDMRNEYMLALEKASVDKDIKPFAQFISERVESSYDKL